MKRGKNNTATMTEITENNIPHHDSHRLESGGGGGGINDSLSRLFKRLKLMNNQSESSEISAENNHNRNPLIVLQDPSRSETRNVGNRINNSTQDKPLDPLHDYNPNITSIKKRPFQSMLDDDMRLSFDSLSLSTDTSDSHSCSDKSNLSIIRPFKRLELVGNTNKDPSSDALTLSLSLDNIIQDDSDSNSNSVSSNDDTYTHNANDLLVSRSFKSSTSTSNDSNGGFMSLLLDSFKLNPEHAQLVIYRPILPPALPTPAQDEGPPLSISNVKNGPMSKSGNSGAFDEDDVFLENEMEM
jgi:hypothetical protein